MGKLAQNNVLCGDVAKQLASLPGGSAGLSKDDCEALSRLRCCVSEDPALLKLVASSFNGALSAQYSKVQGGMEMLIAAGYPFDGDDVLALADCVLVDQCNIKPVCSQKKNMMNLVLGALVLLALVGLAVYLLRGSKDGNSSGKRSSR